jgi:2-oxoglutarate dehydrogenase E2 component (dihydrolipoamide succinyltransferase)
MALVEMIMPKMGESVMEATILSWLKKEGESIEQDESVLEVATDKVDTEVPSAFTGVLKKILVKSGEIVPVGQAIAIIETEKEIKHPLGLDELPDDYESAEELRGNGNDSIFRADGLSALTRPGTNRFYSPLVRSIAQKENITIEELDQLKGTGKKDRITKDDLMSYLEKRKLSPKSKEKYHGMIESSVRSIPGPEDEIRQMDRIRMLTAEKMLESKRISAHVTSFVEADVTNIVTWRDNVKDHFQQLHGHKLTYTPIFLEAIIKALRDFPMINGSVDGDKLILHKHINLGMAVALPGYNLIVPVIHKADQYSLVGLVQAVNDLAERARNNQLRPDELVGGTYTVTNVGSFGNITGTPIILQPQLAILALGMISKKPAVIETPYGDAIGIRQKMYLSHTYDHRIIDGALGGSFIRKVALYLEAFDVKRKI